MKGGPRMSDDLGLFVGKVLRVERIVEADIEAIHFSEGVRKFLRETGNDTLQELAGDDPQPALRKLAAEYWGTR